MFFYKLGYEEAMNLPIDVAASLWENITVIEAQEMRKMFEIQIFPNLKEEARINLDRKYHKMAYPEEYSDKPLTTAELARKLANVHK